VVGGNTVAVKALRSLGYDVAVKPVVGDRFWGAVGDSRNRAQIGFTGYALGYPDPGAFLAQVFSCAAFLPGDPDNQNPSAFCDPGIDRQMRRAHAEQLSDPTGSRARWQRVDREITDAAPWVPLMVTKDVNFLSTRVGNYQYSPANGMLIDQLWVR
jgi:peptide/nickel transport system substrate-binding protein